MTGKKRTPEEFIEEMSKINPNIEILGTYTKAQNRVLVRCKICGHEWEPICSNLIKGKGCPKCSHKKQGLEKRLTTDQFIEKARKVHGDKYDYSKFNYETAIKKGIIICPEHGEFEQTPNNHLSGKGCPKCGRKIVENSKRLGLTTFIQRSNEIHNNKYDYSKFIYVNNSTKGIVICPKHGEFEITPANHLNGSNCPRCANENRSRLNSSNTEEFIQKAKEIHGNKYDYSKVKYTRAIDKVIIICLKHGEFEQDPHNHLSGKGCPKCNQSKGENFIEEYLIKNNIQYIPQYQININNDINPTGICCIDFYIPHKNLFIEYNGIQHYVPLDYFGGKIKFERQQKRDEYVRNYCKENNIQLLEISYNSTDDEILNLLNSYIYE